MKMKKQQAKKDAKLHEKNPDHMRTGEKVAAGDNE